jgi:cytoplasmic iron level regulating protein YaaA (DUF328/UPF0246 family)
MLILISPAKTLDYQSPLATTRYTQPELLEHSQSLSALPVSCRRRKWQTDEHQRQAGGPERDPFHDWQPDFTDNARQAILAFKGDVYTGLQAETFSEADFDFAQQHLRMLSGLYGVLRPLDLMQPIVWRWGLS